MPFLLHHLVWAGFSRPVFIPQILLLLFAANQFGIYSGSDPGNYQLAFVVYNGQVFMNEAFIRDGTITNAKIADATIAGAKIANATIDMAKISDTIQSTN